MEQKIKMTNRKIEEIMFNPGTAEAIKQEFPGKNSYWIARAFDRVEQLYKPYQKEVQKVVEQYAQKETINGKEKVMRWPNKKPVWGDNEEVAEAEIEVLKDIEVDLGIDLIDLDLDKLEEKGINVAPVTFMIIQPFLKDM